MRIYKNLVLIGTSHIATTSIREIERAFESEKPDLVAVELDKARLDALFSNVKPKYPLSIIPKIGLKGYLFARIGGLIQQKLGAVVGIKPGSDMLRAVMLAQKNNKPIALIDRDISITLSRLSKSITWREKLHFIIDFFSAPFSKKLRIDLTKVPEKEFIHKLLNILKKRYPNIYNTLVKERNEIMGLKLASLMKQHVDKKILAVIGAGHEDAVLEIIKARYVKSNKTSFHTL